MRYFKRHSMRGLMITLILLETVTWCVTTALHAQDYPNRDITFIVPFAPGGSTDPLSRQFTAQLKKILQCNITVENKPGGAATIGNSAIVRSKPDGYTIGLGTNVSLAYQPLITPGLPYKTPDDYQPIVKLADQYVMLTVRADAKWKSFDEFMADVRKYPGKIRVSVSGLRGTTDLALQHFSKVAGVRTTVVPFSGGGGEALLALLGGRVEANAGQHASTIGQERAGKVRVLAVFKKGKDELFPGAVSAFDAGGYGDATLPSALYVIGSKGMPKEVFDKLVTGSLQVVQSDEYQKFAKMNGFLADAKGPEAVKAELVDYGKIFSELVKFIDQK